MDNNPETATTPGTFKSSVWEHFDYRDGNDVVDKTQTTMFFSVLVFSVVDPVKPSNFSSVFFLIKGSQVNLA